MQTLRIKLDVDNGPIWKDKFDPETGILSTGIPLIDNDPILNSLNDNLQQEYADLYSFQDGRLEFDSMAFDHNKKKFLSSLQAILHRIDEINDGTIEIVDEASKFLGPRDTELWVTEEYKQEYLSWVYEEMERRGIPKEDIPRVIAKTGFMDALEDYPDVQLLISTEDAVDEILVVAALH